MTSSGGTGRPTAREAHADAPNQAGAGSNGAKPAGNGKGDGSETKSNRGAASTAYEVAASLRSRASRAAQATKGAASKLQNAGNGAEASGQPDPAVTQRKQQPPAEGSAPRGAAAARAATSSRSRRGNGKADASSASPAAAAAAPPPPAAAGNGATAPADAGRPQAPNQAATAPTSQVRQPPPPRPAPVPPPSLVAEQAAAAAAAAAAAPANAPVAPPPPIVRVDPADTQTSIEAHPAETAPPRPQSRTSNPVRRAPRVRKARLRLLRIDPWSVMKTAFLLSVALGITLFVAVAVLWSVLDAAGVFDSVGGLITDVTASDTNAGININQYIELSRVLGFTTLIAVVDVVLITAMATLGAFLYNLSASLLGGLELTLAEDD